MEKYIDEHLDEIINDIKELVAYNSINCDDAKPFGKQNQLVLDKALEQMKKKGFKTENLDYYCGYGEVGEGEKVVGVVSHLDIVPAGEGWESDPFTLTTRNNTLYGRGVSDDKGDGVAASWAIKYLVDSGYKFKKRVRLIYGCNEEKGSLCVKHYVEKCGDLDCGFTPDAEFPGIYAEKGMVGGILVGHHSKIVDIKAGDATNIVAKKCVTTIPSGSINEEKLANFFKNNNINYEIKDNVLTVYGVAAHASTPDLGVNAINYTMAGLQAADFNDSFVDFFMKNIGLTYHGELMHYEELADDVSNTSINIGVAYKKDNDVCLTLDMRFPVKSTYDKCVAPLLKIKETDNEFIASRGKVEPLYFDINSPFIKALDKAYRDVTKDYEHQMQAIGGGTYAKAMKNIIAFGGEFIGVNNHIHDANESMNIDHLKQKIMIYAEAIKNLNEV